MAASANSKTNFIKRLQISVDKFQQRHKLTAFLFAVVKKYGEDQSGYQGALITYYGFLSLFPLLIVATSVADLIAQHNQHLQQQLLSAITKYFPIIGNQLESNVHGSSKTGIALIIGLVVALYGARGIADAVRHALNHSWQVPLSSRPGFPKNIFKSLLIIVVGGVGILVAGALSSVATALGHSIFFSALSTLVSLAIIFCVLVFVMTYGTSKKISFRKNLPGACIATIGIQILTTFGGYLIVHQLHNLKGAYGEFALVLAVFFWIYLLAEVFLYAVEINTVLAFRLWPRSLAVENLTEADKKAAGLYADRAQLYKSPPQEIDVHFDKK